MIQDLLEQGAQGRPVLFLLDEVLPILQRRLLGKAPEATAASDVAVAYPFHPTLVDLMRERRTAVDAFQRTRGALRFLASCLYSLEYDPRWLTGRGVPGRDPTRCPHPNAGPAACSS